MVLQMMDVGPLTMTMYDKVKYIYPMGAKAVGWLLALSSILMIPIVAFVTIGRKQGTIKEVYQYHIYYIFVIKYHITKTSLFNVDKI